MRGKFKKIPRYIKNSSNFPFWLSMLEEARAIIDFKKINYAIDFGCGGGGFLFLLNLYFPHISLTGIEKQKQFIDKSKELNEQKKKIKFIHTHTLAQIAPESQDIIFSQETVYTIENLAAHASECFNVLKKGGYYIFTIGCHTQNPTWQKRKDRINFEESYTAYEYSPTEIAQVFYKTGFRINVKRLPVLYPLNFDCGNNGEFSTIEDLLISSEEYKLLFVLLKPKYALGS